MESPSAYVPSKTRSRGNPDRPSRANRNSRKARPSRRSSVGFLAIDGESVNEDGEHRYVMMAASDGSSAFNPKGLSTSECFEWLLSVKEKNPRRRFVAFGLNYDVNMMLRDLSPAQLKRLWESTRILATLDNGQTYRIEWIPGKSFSFSHFMGKKKWVRISDTFGFFQMSFVRSLEKWHIADPGGHIARMKGERSDFRIKDKDKILAYCVAECELLVMLMNRLEDALQMAELSPSQWNGAGAVAAATLKRFQVKRHLIPDIEFPERVHEAVMHSYFGGRTEIFLQGVLTNVVNYDLCSAYPSEALFLPSLVGGRWRKTNGYEEGMEHGIYRVRWDVPEGYYVMPFPFRHKGGIYYPRNGEGWYHAKEVRAALPAFKDFLSVREGWVFEPANDIKPFSFVSEIYEARAEAKRNGHASEKAFKLGINALYGKLAQGRGFMGRIPPYQSFFWAGAITAGTRSRLLDMASANLSGVVSMATDGIVFSGDPDFPVSDKLGGLEKSVYREIFLAQPGIYRCEKDTGEEMVRTRGFFVKEIDWDDLKEGWLKHGPHYVQRSESTRFVGAGSALMRSDLEEWRKWITSERVLRLYSSRKYYPSEGRGHGRVMRLLPGTMPTNGFSEVYVPKGRRLNEADQVATDFVQGMEQPLEDF